METRPVRVPTYAQIVRWDDPTLFEWREVARAQLLHRPDAALQRRYDFSTAEVANRTRASRERAAMERRAS